MTYPRDMVGYGRTPPHPHWPGEARIALQFVVNYEEGGENCVLHGDPHSEVLNSDNVGITARRGERDPVTESFYEYGSRAGYWRVMRLFDDRGLKSTVFAIGMAMERNPEVGRHAAAAGHEICCHGWRWFDYRHVPEAQERDHIDRAVRAIEQTSGQTPVGWYTGRISERTRALVAADGRFLYDSDAYCDDLPYWTNAGGKPWLVVPYAFDTNDMRFASAPGFNTGRQFFEHLRDTFDFLYREGETSPKMMSVGLHCRLAGRPGRAAALERFIDHALAHEGVWICRRDEIARHWIAHHAPSTAEIAAV